MRFVSVSYHVPDTEGSAAGRVLHATVDGLRSEGHEVSVLCWRPEPPVGPMPAWCSWVPFPARGAVARRVASVLRPRSEAEALAVEEPAGAVHIAEDYLSFSAVAHLRRVGVVVHNLSTLDRRALGTRRARDVQDARAESRAVRRAELVLATSPRVAGSLVSQARVVPAAISVPPEPLPVVAEPVAANVADWRWPPNRWALGRLLQAWPEVHGRVTGARLLLAGPGLEHVGTLGGVEVLGPVPASVEVLRRAAVLAFPCPPTSGPKIKVLEALAAGLPVVTTAAGTEGLAVQAGHGVVVADVRSFAGALASVLADPARRSALAGVGREAVLASHAPGPAARARVAACVAAFDPG